MEQGLPAEKDESPSRKAQEKGTRSSVRHRYIRFGLMILTAMIAMYAMTYINTYELGHVRFSETRLYMTLVMGAAMAVIMLAFMLTMYKSLKVNIVIVVLSIAIFASATWLVRSQVIVEDRSAPICGP